LSYYHNFQNAREYLEFLLAGLNNIDLTRKKIWQWNKINTECAEKNEIIFIRVVSAHFLVLIKIHEALNGKINT
jgi:hypothetical protein